MTSAPETATLLVNCPDARGIVAALAGQFFQRIRFDLAELHTDRVALEQGIRETAERFAMSWRLAYTSQRKRMAVFVSKYDHCLYDLLLRHRAGELQCDIGLIISNHPDLEPIARQFDVPYYVFPIRKDTKAEQEARELELLAAERIDLVVLARYMQILSSGFIEHHPGRIINIHHSFLPAFMGGKPYHQAMERGVKLIGATAHYATTDLDEGPIIEQDVIRTSHRDSVADLVRKGRDVERSVLARAVRWHLEDRILVCGNKTVVFDG
jgi:formyltetrahydrofolate deformylase